MQEINQQLIKENKALFEETKIIAQLKQKSNSLAAQNEDTQKNEPIKDDLLTKSVKTQEIFDQKIKTIENEYATNIEKLNKEVDELKILHKTLKNELETSIQLGNDLIKKTKENQTTIENLNQTIVEDRKKLTKIEKAYEEYKKKYEQHCYYNYFFVSIITATILFAQYFYRKYRALSLQKI